jgi:hypothetical protein
MPEAAQVAVKRAVDWDGGDVAGRGRALDAQDDRGDDEGESAEGESDERGH